MSCAECNEDVLMTNASNLMNSPSTKRSSYRLLFILGTVFFLLLLLRDTYSVGINKYIFLGIACVCVLTMKTSDLIYLYCFLFPLYVGLPGNFLTIILIVRLLCEIRRFKISSFLLTLLMAILVFIQNYSTGKTGTVPMMFIPSLFLVLLLFTYKPKLESAPMIIMFSAGVAACGFIMLASTLRVHSLSSLMSTAFRLGTNATDYTEAVVMNVSIDPNFYGTFAMTAITLAFPMFMHPKTPKLVKVLLAIFAFIQLIVSLVGLSRTFMLVLLFWIMLYLLTEKNAKNMILATIVFIVFLIFLIVYMSDVIETGFNRFDDADMVTANGRLSGITRFWNIWVNDIYYIFMGVGIFRCNVHCVPIQFFFGGGVVLFALGTLLLFSFRTNTRYKRDFASKLPSIVTFIMMCTVPALGLLNFMFPLVLVGLCDKE